MQRRARRPIHGRGRDLSPNGLEPPPQPARSMASLALTAGAVPSILSGAWNASPGALGSGSWSGEPSPPAPISLRTSVWLSSAMYAEYDGQALALRQ